jgi:hypothetical protein
MVSVGPHLRLLLLVFEKDRLHIRLLARMRGVFDSDVARVRTQKRVRLLAFFDFLVLNKESEVRSDNDHIEHSDRESSFH